MQEQAAVAGGAVKPIGDSRPCPNCFAPMAPGARLCVACGYDLKKRKRLKTKEVAAAGAATEMATAAAKAAGTFALGVVLSLVCALAGAAVWWTVAMLTGYYVAWIAWGLGILTGFGMLVGYREANAKAGVAAACIVVLGIVSARVTIFAYMNAPLVQAALSAPPAETAPVVTRIDDERVHRLAGHHSELAARRSGLSYNTQKRNELYEAEFEKFTRMSDKEIDEAIAELDAWEAGGRWSGADYVRYALVYEYIDRAVAAEEDAEFPSEDTLDNIAPEEWKKYHTAAVAKADALSDDEQVEELKRIEAENLQRVKRWRLATHRADLRAQKMGLSYADEKREAFFKEEAGKLRKLSGEKLDIAIAELDAWKRVANGTTRNTSGPISSMNEST